MKTALVISMGVIGCLAIVSISHLIFHDYDLYRMALIISASLIFGWKLFDFKQWLDRA